MTLVDRLNELNLCDVIQDAIERIEQLEEALRFIAEHPEMTDHHIRAKKALDGDSLTGVVNEGSGPAA